MVPNPLPIVNELLDQSKTVSRNATLKRPESSPTRFIPIQSTIRKSDNHKAISLGVLVRQEVQEALDSKLASLWRRWDDEASFGTWGIVSFRLNVAAASDEELGSLSCRRARA
jgi:hypothetical protein